VMHQDEREPDAEENGEDGVELAVDLVCHSPIYSS
jgi:hypothetical protein